MIYIGNDIVRVARIENAIIKYGNRFLNRIFTDNEIMYCNSKYNAAIHFSGRFAAKESIKKVIMSVYPNISLAFKNINIKRNENGHPFVNIINFNSKNIEYIQISISHTNDYATAIALLNTI